LENNCQLQSRSRESGFKSPLRKTQLTIYHATNKTELNPIIGEYRRVSTKHKRQEFGRQFLLRLLNELFNVEPALISHRLSRLELYPIERLRQFRRSGDRRSNLEGKFPRGVVASLRNAFQFDKCRKQFIGSSSPSRAQGRHFLVWRFIGEAHPSDGFHAFGADRGEGGVVHDEHAAVVVIGC
jgi:hypothetical protein